MDRHSLKSLLAFLSITGQALAVAPVVTSHRNSSAPRVSPNRKLTRGARQMSQRERANRRKAKRRS